MKDAYSRYERFQMDRGMVQGNIKVELAVKIENAEKLALFERLF
jgi:hypothetical protein